MRTVVFSSHPYDRPFLLQAAGREHDLIFYENKLDANSASLAQGAEAIALFTSDQADAVVLGQLHALGVRFICLRSVGYDHVNLSRARELGIRVANVPEYSPYAIAEHTVALLMALNRKIVLAQKLMDLNDYRLDLLTGFDLHGKTVGIIGTGRTGAAFASIMKGFGCKLLGYDPAQDPALIAEGLQYVELPELYGRSDVISLHCPLNPQTHYLLNSKAFAAMKPGVTILNTARGGIIDTAALIGAIEAGIVGLAGLDVYEKEKDFFFENFSGSRINDPLYLRLRSFPNVLITGHQAFLTREALEGIAGTTARNLDQFASGQACDNEL